MAGQGPGNLPGGGLLALLPDGLGAADLRALADQLRDSIRSGVVLLGAIDVSMAAMAALVSVLTALAVPVLGSVPVLGRLFRSDNKNIETTNLIIFITAKTLHLTCQAQRCTRLSQ